MSSTPPLPNRPSLAALKKQAKELRKRVAAGDAEALRRVDRADGAGLSLRDAQQIIAREYGFDTWAALKERVEAESGKRNIDEIRAERRRACTSSPEEIARVVEAACGSPPVETQRMTAGFSNEVHRVTTRDGQSLTYRANWYSGYGGEGPRFEGEQWALAQCTRIGVPAPQMLYLEHGLKGFPERSVCVNTYIEGRPLQELVDEGRPEGELRPLVEEAGELLGVLHGVRTEGFGRLDARGRGPAADWHAAYLESFDRERLHQAARNTGVAWAVVEDALRLLADHADLGAGLEPRLLHEDWSPEHVIVAGGRVAGFIDFELCTGGDPACEQDWFGTGGSGWFGRQEQKRVPREWLYEGYARTGPVDERFAARSRWFGLRGTLGGFSYHGVEDVNTAGMMDFLKGRLREALGRARRDLG